MSDEISIVIVDDEHLARERIKRLIDAIDGYHVIAEASNAGSAMQVIHTKRPDIVLLDISMPGASGLELVKFIEDFEQVPAVIFCTAHEKFAVEAFTSCAVGYLLKPVRVEQLEQALKKAVGHIHADDGQPTLPPTYLVTKSHRGIERLPSHDIFYFQADQKYVIAYHINGQTLLEDSLKALEEQLQGQFIRIHRSTLVAVNRIQGLVRQSDGNTCIKIEGCEKLPVVSRRHLKAIKKLLLDD